MPGMDKTQEIRRLHQTMYEQSLLFLSLKGSPDCDTSLMVETRALIMHIYGRIQELV